MKIPFLIKKISRALYRKISVLVQCPAIRIFYLLCSMASFVECLLLRPSFRAILVVSFYDEQNRERLSEYARCFYHNIKNPWIDEIHVFYENRQKAVEGFLQHPKIAVHDITKPSNRQITFGDLIDYANARQKDRIVIIANTDIFFDSSLRKLERLEWNGKVVALTRHNTDCYGSRDKKIWLRHKSSQDAWIFKAPLSSFFADIKMGWMACDGRLAYEMKSAGLELINPSLDIRAWHIHKEQHRAYISDGHNYMLDEEQSKKVASVLIGRLTK